METCVEECEERSSGGLQLLLPTDKRNPSLSLYHSPAKGEFHVFYGFELLEVVPARRESVPFKLLVARLYNAGLKVAALEETFGVDRKTIRKWGQALVSGEPEQLGRVLLGVEVCRKRNASIDAYVWRRWKQLNATGCRNYRERLQQEILEVFQVRLSGETLRLMLAQLKAQSGPTSQQVAQEAPDSEVGQASYLEESTCSGDPTGEGGDGGAESGDSGRDTKEPQGEARGDSPPPSAAFEGKSLPPLGLPWQGSARLCDHAGLLLFARALTSLPEVLEPSEPLLGQWLGSILLGAVNVEQTKYLNWEDLSLLLGSVVRFPTPQREALQRLATTETVGAVLRWNLQQLGGVPTVGTDLYFDPHTKHYTGTQPVLKGWCASIRWADKVMHSDFVHSSRGHPIYFECTDNFADLRARFGPLVGRLRATLRLGQESVLSFIVDRGIYSHEVFEHVMADAGVHLITWQKGYEAQPWDRSALSGSYALERRRNHSRDVRLYQFEYIDRAWEGLAGMRQILVRATDPWGVVAQVAILSDDLERPAQHIVELMFRRWVQENDFKYLDKHFGINQITSYRSIAYEELAEGLEDRQMPNHAYLEEVKIGKVLLKEKARLLLAGDQAQRAERQRQERISHLQNPMAPPPLPPDPKARAQELAALKNASRRFEKYRQQRALKIESVHETILQHQVRKEGLQKEVSRIEQLVEQGMVRMDSANKTLMDALKITARNLFYQALAPFKAAYDNYRDDHDYFRELTQCGGVLSWSAGQIQVHLVTRVNFSPKLQKIISSILEGLNQKGLTLPDGSGRKLCFHLTQRQRIEVRVKEPPD
jgi:hypothetical protein